MTILRYIIFGAAILLAIVTALSTVESARWWIRTWDFPRLLIAVLAVVTLVAALFLTSGTGRALAVAAMLCVVGWQSYRIFPYTPLPRPEVEKVQVSGTREEEHCIRALSFNVLQTNRDYDRTIRMIEEVDADIVLLLETDQQWVDAVEPVTRKYPHKLLAPLDNLYGLAFYTRLDIANERIEYLVEDDIPSVHAQLSTRGGRKFRFMGLHPRPPQPGNDTEMRDAEIAIGARMAAKHELPVLAMGDFNDVAWSRTSQLFKRIGHYLDPRIGRGFFATFPASWPVFRWPLDHLFMTQHFTFSSVDVLGKKGSDHLPILASLCLLPEKGKVVNDAPEAVTRDDKQEAKEMIEDAAEAKKEEGETSSLQLNRLKKEAKNLEAG